MYVINVIDKLQDFLKPEILRITDVSYYHRHHGNFQRNGMTHLVILVISREFEGKSLKERHRIIYDILKEELRTHLHSLQISCAKPPL